MSTQGAQKTKPILKFLDPPSMENATRNILLYGPSGTGKTVGACSAPGPILVVNADGQGALAEARRIYGNDKIREVAFRGKETLRSVYKYLNTGGDGENTLVVDPIGDVYRILLEEYGSQRPSLQQYGDVNLLS